MWVGFKKKRILKKFVNKLPGCLARRYGVAEYYSLGQLQCTLDEEKYPEQYRGYAMVMFLTENNARAEIGIDSVYDDIRQELANRYYDGDIEFSTKPLTKRVIGNPAHANSAGFGGGAVGGGD